MRGKLTCDGGVVVNGGRRGGLTVVCNRRCWLFFLFLCIFLFPFFYYHFSFPMFFCSFPFFLWLWWCCWWQRWGGWRWFAVRNGDSCCGSSSSLCRDTNLHFSFLFPSVFLHLISLYYLVLFSIFLYLARFFSSPLLFFSDGIYRGRGSEIDPTPVASWHMGSETILPCPGAE